MQFDFVFLFADKLVINTDVALLGFYIQFLHSSEG
jgi:hypothetical protein